MAIFNISGGRGIKHNYVVFVMVAMLLVCALDRSISPGISGHFLYFWGGGDLLCFGHWLGTWRPCEVSHAQ